MLTTLGARVEQVGPTAGPDVASLCRDSIALVLLCTCSCRATKADRPLDMVNFPVHEATCRPLQTNIKTANLSSANQTLSQKLLQRSNSKLTNHYVYALYT